MGTSGADTLTGTVGADVIVGLSGDDVIDGKGGNDKICGGDGNDILSGGSGNDGLDGGPGSLDIAMFADATNHVSADLQAGAASGNGTDTITTTEGVVGSLYDDTLFGDGGFNLIAGLSGDDTIDGRSGGDIVAFLSAAGSVTANLATGTSSGLGEGTDSLSNIGGLAGSTYGDFLRGDDNQNLILGLGDSDELHGGGGNDALWGGDGNDQVDGGDGLDRLYGDPGDDAMDGGPGPYNIVSYALVPGPVTINLGAGTATGAGTDTLSNITAAEGSPAGDAISGDGTSNVLSGLAANDTISGLAGNDILDGGNGTDALDGGAGDADTCANGESVTGCEVASSTTQAENTPLLSRLSTALPRLGASASSAPPAAVPPRVGMAPVVDAVLADDSQVQSATVECWLRYVGASSYDIIIGAPWLPAAWSGAVGETEWFIPRIYKWDPGALQWVPATEFGNDAWGQWAYTAPSGPGSLITVPFGGPWFNGTTGVGYATRQWWSVNNGFYLRIAGWVEWHDRAGLVEAHTPLVWMNSLYGADVSGPWCYG